MSSNESFHPIRVFIRALVPLGIVGAGVMAYVTLANNVVEDEKPPAEVQTIRTRVTDLKVSDYQVVITTQGIVQPINEVTVSAEVSGQVVSVSPQFEAGSYFAKGDVLLQLDDRDYKTAVTVAKAQELSAKSALELATLNHDRIQKLFDRNGASSIAEVNQSAATQAQAQASLDSATAAVEQAERDLERTSIIAPFSGRVRSKEIGLGHSVGIGAPLGRVFAVDYAEVRLPIAGRELRFLNLPEHTGDAPVEVELRDAISRSDDVWRAQIVRTEGALDPDSLELFAIARIEDPFGLQTGEPPLRIGQPVQASIEGKVLHKVVALPRKAVRQLDKINLVERDELTLMPLTIEAVWSDEEHIIVRKCEVDPSALLATTPIVYAVEGSKVEIISDSQIATSPEATAAVPAEDGAKAN